MNNPLMYVLLTRFKNRVLSIIKKPSQIIVILILAACFGITIFGGNANPGTSFFRDINELFGICMILFGASFILTSFSGISKGASLFSMSDVNLMFPSPTNSISILVYGLVQQMTTSLLLGLFILFQYSTAHNLYGMSISFLIVTFFLYALVSFSGQLSAMVIYILTSSDDKKRNIAKYSFVGIFVAFIGAVFIKAIFMGSDNLLKNLVSVANEFWVMLFPVVGWAKMILTGIYGEKNILFVVLGIALWVIYIALGVVLVKFKQTDYYEDVLKATEVSFSAITAKKEGKIAEAVPQKVKVGKTGIGKGDGSDVFYYKHLVESRRMRTLFFDIPTLVYMAIICVFAFIFKNDILPVLIASIYMQMFSTALGRWTRELLLPYVYLIPENPMKKLINCLKESFVKIIREAVILFVIVGVIMKLDVGEIIGLILIRISCGILFTGTNLFCERFLGGISMKGVLMILYFLISIVAVLPAAMAGFVLYNFIIAIPIWGVYVISAVINTLTAVLVLFMSRNVLQYAEVNNR